MIRAVTGAVSRFFASILLGMLWVYKHGISPYLPDACRFEPTCSVYAAQAVRTHGPLKGSWLAARRLSRCHPFHAGGLDPVPPALGEEG